MKCPKCKKNMVKQWDAVTNNGQSDKKYKEYKKNVYWCKENDIWVSIETPISSS